MVSLSLSGKRGKLLGVSLIVVFLSLFIFTQFYINALSDSEFQLISSLIFCLHFYQPEISLSVGVFYIWSINLLLASISQWGNILSGLSHFMLVPVIDIFFRTFFYDKYLQNPLSNLDQLIIEIKNSSKIFWTYRFLTNERNLPLPSGFTSMIKIFTDEMRESGVSRFEKSEIGTLHRIEGESIVLTCITGYRGFVSSDVEKRIIDKIHKFVSLVESELTTELNLWSESLIDSQRFEEKLFKLLTSAIKLKGLEKIEKSKIKWLRKQRPKLKKKLEELYINMEKYNTRFKKGKRSYPEYEERKRREWYYYKAKKKLTYTILSLSQIPPYTSEPNDKKIVKELERLK